MKIEIPFLNGKKSLEYEADSMKDAVMQAVKNKDDLSYANLACAKFVCANLRYAKLVDANLLEAIFTGSSLSCADFSGANLSCAKLGYADLRRAYLGDANLSDANLNQAESTHADFSRANLRRATFRRANLSQTTFRQACLRGVDLRYANLTYADLRLADLTGANLRNANLYSADLRYAKIQDKKLWSKRPFLSLGQCGSVNRTTLAFFFEDGSEPFIMCGCFKGGLKEFKARIKETHSGTFYEVEYNIMASHITELYKQQLTTNKEGEVNES